MKTLRFIAVISAGFLFSCASRPDMVQALFRRIDTAEVSGDFPKPKQAETMCPDLSVLLRVTKADVHEWAAQKGLKKGEYDAYPLEALTATLLETKSHQDYLLAHFDEIQHPDLKEVCGVLLFNQNRRSPSLTKYLKQVVANPSVNLRGGMRDEDFLKLKKEVLALPEPQVGSNDDKREVRPR